MNSQNNIVIPDALKNVDADLLKEALKYVEERKAKAEKPKREKKVLTPEQVRENALRDIKKKLAEANGLKAQRVQTKEPERVRGRGHLNDALILEYAQKMGFKYIYLHKGKLSELTWLSLELDLINLKYINQNTREEHTSLSAIHKKFCEGQAVAVKTTLNNSYFSKGGEPKRNKAFRLSELEGDQNWKEYTPVSSRNTTPKNRDSEEKVSETAVAPADEEELVFEAEPPKPVEPEAPAPKKGRKMKVKA
jgi:hypothetical protein